MRRRGGFTLIEIMVGVALLALFLSGVYSVAVGTLLAKRKIQETQAIFTAGPTILDIVERDLRGAYIVGVKDLKALKAIRQRVGGAEVTLLDVVTTVNSKVSREVDDEIVRSDVTEIGYRIRPNDNYPNLLELYRREEFFFDDDPLKGGEYYLVYDRVRSFTIDFFEYPDATGATSNVSREEGKEEWDSEESKELPRAARITLEIGPPPELNPDLETDDRTYKFVRWVLFPNAYDERPEEDQGPEGNGN